MLNLLFEAGIFEGSFESTVAKQENFGTGKNW